MITFVIGLLVLHAPPASAALGPESLVLVANKAVPESLRVARYYMEKRHVPAANLVIVSVSNGEEIGREEYENGIASPVRRFLTKNDPEGKRFACLVTVYGTPLRIGPRRLGIVDAVRVRELRMRLSGLRDKEKAASGRPQGEDRTLKDDIARMEKEIADISHSRERASVDSELALVRESGYPLEGWLPNRYFMGFRGREIPGMPRVVLPVCRLDGPTEAIVKRMIDDSLYAEEHGLAGKAYFDARWPEKSGKDLSAYQAYDLAIHRTADMVKRSGRMPVILDQREALLGPGEAPDAALYCGWYSLAKYVDAFTWARGAVGFHVASSECITLKDEKKAVWCKMMLQKGAAATIGPVAEPYLQSFPEPGVFFASLLDGNSLIESYTVSNPFWSWQMVLIGDPLYRPFKTFQPTGGSGSAAPPQ